MSCHSIGAALNNVGEKILEMYENGKIDAETAKELLCTIRRSVHFCDGNEYEATETLEENYCGCCLRKMKKDDLFLHLYHTSDRVINNHKIMNLYKLGSDKVCYDCFCKLLYDYTKIDNIGEMEKDYIMQHYEPYDYKK